MSAEWLNEGLRQLRLALLWRGYAGLLETAGAAEAAHPLRRMTGLLLTQPWLPGLAEAVEELCAGIPGEAFVGDDGPCAIENRLRDSLPAATEANDRLRVWLLDGARQVRAGAAPAARPASTAADVPPKEGVWEGPVIETRLRCWIGQALALGTWLQGKDERRSLRQRLGRRSQWTDLRDACQRVGQRLNDTASRGWSFFHRARTGEGADEASEVLLRCGGALDELLKDGPMEPAEGLLDRLEERTTALLDSMPPDWPPLCLAHLPAGLALLRRLAAAFDRTPPWLSAPVPLRGLMLDGQSRLLLARLVVETFPACEPSTADWSVLARTIRVILEPTGLRVELVHALPASAPPEWFELHDDGAIVLPRLERVGLMVRISGGSWVGFPQACVRAPSLRRMLEQLLARLAIGPSSEQQLTRLCLDLMSVAGAASEGAGWRQIKANLREGYWRLLLHLSDASSTLAPCSAVEVETSSVEGQPPARTRTPPTGNRWSRLPSPPHFPTPTGDLSAPPLLRWHAEAVRLSETQVKQRDDSARAAFREWLNADGGDWFDRLARAAHEDGEGAASPARAWLVVLLEEQWCRCYPAVNPASGALSWPADAPPPHRLEWIFDPEPPGSVLRVERFAPSAEAARLTLSQGNQGTVVALDAADKVRIRTATLSTGRDLLEGPAGRLLEQTRMHVLSGAFAVPAETLLGETLDALAQATQTLAGASESPARPLAESSAVWDELLTELRRWGRAFDLDILPRSWSFARPPMRDKLADDEQGGVTLFFRPLDAKGLIYRVRTFGLARGDGRILQPCDVCVSVGPSPAGFSELEALVHEPAHPVETLLQQRLRGWREAVLNGVLDVVAVQLYVDYWGAAGAALRQQAPERAARFAERLATLLNQALGLRTFFPARYQDYSPGWLELASDRGVVSGRVRRVLRPGLQDDRGRLRVPAVVEVE